jgi:vitamin K-dependent gamma-carboxylase
MVTKRAPLGRFGRAGLIVGAALEAPVSAASLAAFRIAFGLLMFAAVVRFFAHGWIADHFIDRGFYFPFYGFEWVRPWPGVGMYVHFGLMGLFALGVATGTFYRVSVAAFGLLFTYAHLIDVTNYLNHYYLVSCLCLLMTFLPLHRAFSVDAWRTREPGAASVPAWMLWALRAQVGLVYFFGGVAKLKGDWLLRAEPMKTWLAANGEFPILGRLFHYDATAYAMSWAGAAFDLCVVPLLLWRRSRPFAYAAVVAFHVITAGMFQLGLFPWIMIASSTLFFPPTWPQTLLGRLGVKADRWLGAGAGNVSRATPRAAWLLVPYFSLHLLVPFRHLAYPGPVCWTEEGYRFSWNVMLMEKDGWTRFHVRDPQSGQQWTVGPRQYLSAEQNKMMSSQPDMILAFAHFLADEFRAKGIASPEVRVDAYASLNGRPNAQLIDPAVDLAKERDGLAPKRWILPFPSDRRGPQAP